MATWWWTCAKVLWWNDSKVYVRCPICGEIHAHSFDGNYNRNGLFVPGCQLGRERDNYFLRFPFNSQTGQADYRIDKEEALFVASGADPARYPENQLEEFARQSDKLREWTKVVDRAQKLYDRMKAVGGIKICGKYLATDPDVDRRYQILHSPRELEEIFEQHLLDTVFSPLSEELEDANSTPLHIAACTMHPKMVELLLIHRAERSFLDAHVLDAHGRTPLAEAALWGRVENVEMLLEVGDVSPRAQCKRNGQLVEAIDFARPSEANSRERYYRSGGRAQWYNENTYERDLDRQRIVAMLDHYKSLGERQEQIRPPLGFSFNKGDDYENHVTLTAHFKRWDEYKTVAVLDRVGGFPPVAAMSGWKHDEEKNLNIQISGRHWTAEVLELCKEMRYTISRNFGRDGGVPGQYDACHAEKQLIAFFIHEHVLLDSEIKTKHPATRSRQKPETVPEGAVAQVKHVPCRCPDCKHSERLAALNKIMPPKETRVTKATIWSFKTICEDCKQFVSEVNSNRQLGLDIELYHHCVKDPCDSWTQERSGFADVE
ncbi:DYW family of nucleic acid deaminases-domain-containing protein [Astrocystis sublimbata]|nr:DYW family of nucleic acid deaminases-domain-containing protein [Astrocystis sublimbata]